MQALLQPGFDRVARSALLALQFRDAVDGRTVAEGLEVVLQDLWQPRRVMPLVANRSGVFVLHAFPGLTGFDTPAIESPATAGRYRLSVQDALGRYLPLALSPELPSPGLWSLPGGAESPGDAAPRVPLYSAVTRPLPLAMACLRAELRSAARPSQPAAWAQLALWLGSTCIAEGLADEAGRALLLFPLPRPREALLGGSPASQPPAFEWPVTLQACWQATNTASPAPDLADLLAQPAAGLLDAPGGLPLPALTLRAGQTLQAARPPSSFVYVAE
jgi:hypothetical protein